MSVAHRPVAVRVRRWFDRVFSYPGSKIIAALTFLYACVIKHARRKINVTMIGCVDAETPIGRRLVDNEPLQTRAKMAGLAQKRLAQIVGVSENTASLQLRGKWESGTPRYVVAAILAWEMLSHDQRLEWERQIMEVERELKRRGA